MRPELFADAPRGAFELPPTVWADAEESGRLFGLRLEGVWMHVGTPDAIGAAERAILASVA
jgi:MurNAc alpha-1-phosphate uridylyltransferase